MNDAPKLTTARRRALAALFLHTSAGISNRTEGKRIYWQTADWLREVGYAEILTPSTIVITRAGQERAVAEGLTGVAA